MDNGSPLNGYSPDKRMDNPLSTRVIAAASQDMRNSTDKHSPNKGNLHVGFMEEKGEVKEKRERFLTAKYGVTLEYCLSVKQLWYDYLFPRHIRCLLSGNDWQLKCGFMIS